jgi:DNA replication protein DnaC
VDIDDEKTHEKFKDLMGDTLVQSTKRGFHYVYKSDPDFFKTLNKKLRDDGHEMELRVGGAYCVVAPSSVNGEVRKWNNKEIIEMPKDLKEFFMKYYQDENREEKVSDDIEKDIKNNDLNKENLRGLDGCCDDSFIKFGGVLRKKLNKDQVEYTLYNFNQMLHEPLPNKRIRAICGQIEKYDRGDQKQLEKQIFSHLKVVEEASSFEIATSLRYEKKDIENALKALQEEGKVFKRGKNYRAINKAEWKNTFVEESKVLPFNVPYFNDSSVFRNGDMVVIGGKPGIGKSVVAINILKGFIDQGIKPYYINLESGNRFVTHAMRLGLKEGDFYWTNDYHPQLLELEDDAITIIDWLMPDNFAEMDKLFARFAEQLDKHGGLLIVFVQLKKWKDSNGNEHYDFFAPNLLDQFPSFVCKYQYGQGYDSENTFFQTTKIRESKTGLQYLTIPTYFDKSTNILSTRKQ